MFLAEGDLAIGGIEIVTVHSGVNGSPLERILRADAIELRSDNGLRAGRVPRTASGSMPPDSKFPLMADLSVVAVWPPTMPADRTTNT
jgi:hypothetical protein